MSDDTLDGYLDGLAAAEDEFPERLANRGAAYRFAWLNGRDDHRSRPRAPAARLRQEADEAEAKDRMP